ncbi:MAG: glycosyltransferase family 39 protein, partial [bacterium]|nr:glycosyltransferase family 39 protein [bacterium]
FFRFYELKITPPGLYPDEAMNGNNAIEALETGNFRWFYPENNGREGLFINIQALSVALFGNEPWALRLVSALFGTLAILGVYLVTKELFHYEPPQTQNSKLKAQSYNSKFKNFKFLDAVLRFALSVLSFQPKLPAEIPRQIIALLAAFFLATSFWHINFSRVGFRAIMIPAVTSLALYFLLKGLRHGSHLDMVWAGIITGLGFHTYLAIRFFPFVLAVPVFGYLWGWWRNKQMANGKWQMDGKGCIPCLVLLFTLITVVVVSPLIIYFVQNPQDFVGRTGQIAIFSASNPLLEFLKSNLGTLGMFFYQGDCNWRHNYNCAPALSLPLAILFAIGFFSTIFKTIRNHAGDRIAYATILGWFLFMTLPATLTREGIPHALRSIGLIPPVMIMTALGAWQIGALALAWFEIQKNKWPEKLNQLNRIEREFILLFTLLLLLIPLFTFRTYFIRWSQHPETYFGFSTDLMHAGQFLNNQPSEIKKYVIVNRPGVMVRGFPMPAQTIMFISNTFLEKNQTEKNIRYILPTEISRIIIEEKEHALIIPLEGKDITLIRELQKKFPKLRVHAPSDFIVLEQ